jgi:2'-5' RNA ligase
MESAMPPLVRTFIAVEITPGVRSRARQLIDRFRATGANVKWVEPENLHLTLSFLGEVDVLEIPEICSTVTAAVGDYEPFDIEVRGVGAFPDIKRPRTVWMGVVEGAEEMVALHSSLEKGLAKLGYRAENRRFRPHITLGRFRHSPQGIGELGELIQQNQDYLADTVGVSEVVVFSSRLDRGGPEYEPLGTIELKGRRSRP